MQTYRTVRASKTWIGATHGATPAFQGEQVTNSLKVSAILVLAAAIIGCGGGGGDNGTTGTTGTTGSTERSVPTVNLAQNGLVNVTFLSGADRRAPGSQIAVIKKVEFLNGVTNVIPDTQNVVDQPISVLLDGYTINSRQFSVSFDATTPVQTFTEFPFEVAQLQEEDPTAPNGIRDLTSANSVAIQPSQPFDVDLKVYPGRQTSLQVRLDDQTIFYDDATGVNFDEDRFTSLNYDLRTRSIRGFISDYVSFDLSGMDEQDRPVTTGSGEAADKILFSGDGIAISKGLGTDSIFELLDPVAIKSGTIAEGPVIGGQRTQNSYTLQELDPIDTPVAALTGIWRPYSDVLSSNSEINAVAFPNSTDDTRQQLVFYKVSGGKIVALWQGEVQYGVNGDNTKGVFSVFPVNTVVEAEPTGEVSGTISNITYVNGVVRRADWDIASAPAEFPFGNSGAFVVLRR